MLTTIRLTTGEQRADANLQAGANVESQLEDTRNVRLDREKELGCDRVATGNQGFDLDIEAKRRVDRLENHIDVDNDIGNDLRDDLLLNRGQKTAMSLVSYDHSRKLGLEFDIGGDGSDGRGATLDNNTKGDLDIGLGDNFAMRDNCVLRSGIESR